VAYIEPSEPEGVRAEAPAVAVSGLVMRYDATVLQGVDLQVARGEVLAVLGPNGAGKTTMMEILEGYRRPSAGVIEVLGCDPQSAGPEWRERIGIVLQSASDHGLWTVGALVRHVAAHYPRPWPVDDLLGGVGLGDRAGARVGRLSGGQRRRLDLALGLVGRPEVLFLDEPTTGFDPQARRDVWRLLEQVRDGGTAILLTTHALDEAERLADRVTVLDRGQIIAVGSPAELKASALEPGGSLEDAYLALVAGGRVTADA
jgi:ABC-2 type transport system ATP-binding protein